MQENENLLFSSLAFNVQVLKDSHARDRNTARTPGARYIKNWRRAQYNRDGSTFCRCDAGVDICGVVGDSLNGFTDALRVRGEIEWVHVRHEETAAFAAGAD